MPKAVDEMRQVVQAPAEARHLPTRISRLYASYASDFQDGRTGGASDPGARSLLACCRSPSPSWDKASCLRRIDTLPEAGDGRTRRAHPMRHPVSATSPSTKDGSRTPSGSSSRARPRTWRPRTSNSAAAKFAALAYAHLLRGQKAAAVAAAEKALANSQAVKIRFLAARVVRRGGRRSPKPDR